MSRNWVNRGVFCFVHRPIVLVFRYLPTMAVVSRSINISGVQRPGMCLEESQDFYKTWAATYDKDLQRAEYNAPLATANLLLKHFGGKTDVRILDVAAGTGLSGEALQEVGFRSIDALDPSDDMLALAKKKNVYGRLIKNFLGTNRLDIEDGEYDAIVMVGGMAEGHVKCDCLEELIRVVKPGGFVVICMRETNLQRVQEYHNLEPRMGALQREGCWEQVSREVFSNYLDADNGIIFAHRVL
ncbi:WBSCR27 [Branchiostoma lanceolatum]|uniref:WBSCR27 protein n=1 Tax=Branchiostoma lanceolatum TaxID=7740 RepID=A0A8J9ZP17_BRALA|nr:WBSCR27 [Branchiostoma lanceolatum]